MLNKVFESKVRDIPNNIAIKHMDKAVTYDYLNKQANRIARTIYESFKRSGKENTLRVALLFEQGADMVIGCIGAIKAGTTYVPMDPSYPAKRLEYMLKHSDSTIVLTNSKNYQVAQGLLDIGYDIEIINIDSIDNVISSDNLDLNINENSMAYILYTSGSTGEPKGVVQTYKNIYYFAKQYAEKLNISENDRMTLFSAFTHDAAIVDIYSGLLFGATLCPLNVREQIDIVQLPNWLISNEITIWHSVPTLYRYFTSILSGKEQFRNIRYVVLGGESVLQNDINNFKKYFKDSTFINLYGQSESSINSMEFIYPNSTIEILGLGEVLEETEILVIDDEGAEADLLSVGEIVIISDYVALGYWKDEERTNKVFGDDPEVGKTYWTGDLGRLMHNGSIEYMGRKDNQVKIRGYRVELEEIENMLLSHKDIQEVAVVSKKDSIGENYICAYITITQNATNADNYNTTEIRQYLLKELPEYMVPAYFVKLDKLPLTSSGKINRKALPEPDISATTGVEYEAPRNEIEEKLAAIWEELLKIKNIGINDNFFELGGHSLKATILVSMIHKVLHVEIPLRDVFLHATIKELGEKVKLINKSEYTYIEPAEPKEYYQISSAQRRLYVLQQFDKESTSYNMCGVLRIKGQLDIDRLHSTFNKIVKRHESLRTSFELVDEQIVQRIHQEIELAIEYQEANETEIDNIIGKFIKTFDLSKAPLFRVGVIRVSEDNHILMYDMHHIISDGMSMGIIVNEFLSLYEGNNLPDLRIQYKDYSEWQNKEKNIEKIENQGKYWINTLSEGIPVLDMPLDYDRKNIQTNEGATINFVLKSDLTNKLNELALQKKTTINTLLVCAYEILLSKYSEQENIIIGSTVANRNHWDLQGVIGSFINFIPIKSKVNKNQSILEFIEEQKHVLEEAYDNQEYPFEKIVEEFSPRTENNRNPLFDTMLIYHNQIDNSRGSDIAGLKFSKYEYTKGTSTLDFKLDIILDMQDNLNCILQYNTELFKKESMDKFAEHYQGLITNIIENPEVKISEIDILSEEEKLTLKQKRSKNMKVKPAIELAIASTFTSEPIAEYITWWCNSFKENVQITFAPYNQVFQELLDCNSVISSNKGVNLLMIRFEDWIRDINGSEKEKCEILEQNYQNLVQAINNRGKVGTYIIGVFPIAIYMELSKEVISCIEKLNKKWYEELQCIEGINIIDFNQIADMYSIEEVFDEITDKVGHMPFTDEYYAAMGTMIARKLHSLRATPFKVIAVDCDNTLWRGICGEDGVLGIKVEEEYKQLQSLLIQKQQEGMLLVLCSKNNEADVWEVFDKNPEMLLRKEHLAGWKINWESKAENIKQLAEELNLGIDSFIFIDDSAVECYQMMNENPQVLTIQLPEDSQQIPAFLWHIWALDKEKVTDEDRQRTKSYQAERQRKEVQKSTVSIDDFLKELKPKVYINEIKEKSLSRVSQLTQRTNQFNLSTKRRTEEEIQALIILENTKCWTIEVEDKFGQYGLTGIVIMENRDKVLHLDTLLLSCRVLGRGIEDAILVELGMYCREQGISEIQADFYPTKKNNMVKTYLERNKYKIAQDTSECTSYIVDVAEIAESKAYIQCYYNIEPQKIEKIEVAEVKHKEVNTNEQTIAIDKNKRNITKLNWKILSCNEDNLLHAKHILPLTYYTGEMLISLPSQVDLNTDSKNPYEAPRNLIEEKLVEIWKEVLKIEVIGINDSFFELGGQSLKATILMAKIHKVFHVEISLRDIFSATTIKELGEKISGLTMSEYTYIEPAVQREYYQLSPAQRRLYVLQQFDKQSTSYNMCGVLRIEGQLDIDRLHSTFNELVQRHESLRTTFDLVDEQVVQRIHEEAELKIEYKEANENEIDNIIGEFIQAFNLSKAPLIRVGLIKVRENNYILMYDMHHIISDGISMSIIVNEFLNLYEGKSLPKLRIQYKDYSEWQNKEDNIKKIEQKGEYWEKTLKQGVPVLNMPLDYERKSFQSNEGDTINFILKNELVKKLDKLAIQNNTTINTLLLSSYAILLSKYSGQNNIIIGSTVANRNHEDLQGVIGSFINFIPIKSSINKNQSILEFIEAQKHVLEEAYNNQEYPFDKIVEQFSIRTESNRNPIFDTMLIYHNQIDNSNEIDIAGLKFSKYEYAKGTSTLDFKLDIISDIQNNLSCVLEYNTGLFKKETMQRFAVHYELLINKIIENTKTQISEINIFTEEETVEIQQKRVNAIKDITVEIFENETEKSEEDNVFEAPRNEVEEKLVEIWKEILRLDKVGINDNFFDLGGQSLKATTLIAKIHRALNIEISLTEVFKTPTIKGLSNYIKDSEGNIYSEIQPAEENTISQIYTVSSAQKRIYALHQIDSDSIGYNMPGAVEILGNLDISRLESTFKALIKRHESLRTSFELSSGAITQKIHEEVEFKIKYTKIADEREVEDLIKEFVQPFELDKAPLLKAGLITLIDEENSITKNILIFDMHHIISDGVSMTILIKEFADIYSGKQLGDLRIQYKDYAVWQNELFKLDGICEEKGQTTLRRNKLENEMAYWLKQFEDEIPLLNLPTDYPRPAVQSFEGDNLTFVLDNELTAKLKELAKQTGSTLYMMLLATFNILLSKYSGQEDIVVGSPIAGRPHADLENIIGMFVNTLAMRNYLAGSKTFEEFLREVKSNALGAYENQDYQYEELVGKLNITRDLSRNPLFDIVLVMQNMDRVETEIEGIAIKSYPSKYKVSKFDITLTAVEVGDNINLKIEYCTKLFKEATIIRLYEHLYKILATVVEKPNISINEIEIIAVEEKKQILTDFNDTNADYPREKTIKQIFEEQAERTPDNIAISFENQQMTYRELNQKANQLAHILRNKGVGAESIVGILLERSVEMIIGIIAILKAGGAYLPIDPMYPEDRINFMLEDSNTKVLLMQRAMDNGRWTIDNDICAINIDDESIYVGDDTNLDTVSTPESLAYIIYTSGTTGKPKGAMIINKNVVRLMFNDKLQFDFSSKDVWTMFHSMSFDFSVWEMYGALLYGGKLVIVPKIVAQDPTEFIKLMKKEGVTVLNQTPTAFANVVREETAYPEKELNIRYVVFGGEALKPAMLKDWKKKYPETKLINMYGITETTVHVTFKEITEKEIKANISNIGIPIPTLRTYIMDKNLKLMPIGVAGELCVGGDGVCRGYLNRPELTNEKFVENPYVSGERLYRSGDLAKFLPNGEMEYLGRIDHQVKIRGHRIELGEIESRLMKHMSIEEAVVIAKEDARGDKFLCAYLVANEEIDVKTLRGHLSKDCPEYMIPSYFVQLDSMPLTSNGKVDKKALPDPYDSVDAGVEYMPPENELEEKLVQRWQEILSVDKIGVNDSFFSIGGDSIKAISLISSINKSFGASLQMKDIYINQTIRELAISLDEAGDWQGENQQAKGLEIIENIKQQILAENQDYILPVDWEDFYPLSQIQNGMVFYSKLRPDEPIYHDQFIFPVKFNQFDFEMYYKTLQILMNKHEILRTVFDTEDFSIPIQVVCKSIVPNVIMEDLSKQTQESQQARIKDYLKEDITKKFSFNKELLWRIRLFKLDLSSYYIILSFQHAILDGWSVSVFNKEFIEIFTRLMQNKEQVIQPLKSRYKDYVAISLARKTSERTREFWKVLLEGYSRNKLPFNISGKRINGLDGSRIYKRTFGKELLNNLNTKANKYNCSVRDICLSAHIYLMGLVSTENDIVTGMVTHDRPVIEDAEKVLGCFLNTIPVRIKLDKQIKKLELLDKVKKYIRKVKEHELFLSDIAAICGSTGSTENPIFDTLFNFTDFHVLEDVEGSDYLSNVDYDLHIESNEMTNTLFDLEVSTTMDTFRMQIKYAPGYFYEEDIEMAMNLYIRVLEKFIQDDIAILNVEDLVTQKEKNQLLYEFNNTIVEYPKEKTMHQIVEEQVERTPNNIALSLEDKTITYKVLNEKANRLARVLVEAGVKSGDNVGLVMFRDFDMIISMLAILKAGGAYVPVDPDYPQERRTYIAESAKITAMLVYKGYKQENQNESINNVIEIDYAQMDKYQSDNLNLVKDSKDLAYIIYTSGSTGQPKGVMIEHHMAVNLICWVNKEYQIGEKDTLLFITSMCFDLSVYDIFGILSSGGKIVIGKKEQVQNPKELTSLLAKEKITFWDSVPSTMNYIVNSLDEIGEEYIQENLRLVFMSGDWIPVKLPERLKKYFPNAKAISLGGATEGTIWSIYYPIEKVAEYQTSIPYGRPLDNNYFYILDDNMNILPRGIAGELCIGGIGVARGYMNNEEKTKAAFVKDRFQKTDGWMMYKTGDLGRMLPDMTIEFLGRKDHQVKIRGYRVELGEIESQLQLHELIKDAVVIDKADALGNKYLCAYIVADNQQMAENEITVQELRQYLSTKLPDYMIPTYFMYLDKLPLTSNGKIDRKNLPEPDGSISTGTEYEAPRNSIEEKLVELWRDLLAIDKISINDNFFELGGHSLKATSLSAKIHKQLSVEVPLKEIFKNSTIKGLSEYINEAVKSKYWEIQRAKAKEYYSASSAQKRLFALEQFETESTSYNMPIILELEGQLNIQQLEKSFNILIQRHESLRTNFELINQGLVQKVNNEIDFNIKYFDSVLATDIKKIEKIVKDFIRPFDLTKAPLLRVGLITLNEVAHGNIPRYILMIDMHHIISDGVSMNILIKEFIDVYEGRKLKEHRIQYKDYAEWQKSRLETEELRLQEAYWMSEFQEDIPVLDLPTDYTRPSLQSFEGNTIMFNIDKKLKDKLNRIAQTTETTMYMILLSAINIMLAKYSGQEDIVIGTPIAGRPHADLDSVIGMFVNTLAMRNHPAGNKTYSQFLQEVKEKSLRAYENQEYQFEELVEKLNIKRDMSRNPVFDIMFAMENLEIGQQEIKGIKLNPYNMEKKISKFDLTFTATEGEENIRLAVEYCTKLFKQETIEKIGAHLINILNNICEASELRISDIEIMSQDEREQILTGFNNTNAEYPKKKTIHKVFEEQVERVPDSLAVVFEKAGLSNISLSYKELNQKANQLARRLRDKGITPDSIVGIMVEKSIYTIIGIMGILKAGGAYLPIDTEYPKDRIEYMLQDSNAKILLTQSKLLEKIEYEGELVLLDKEELYEGAVDNLEHNSNSNNLAYVMYTSGTTGKPKGVMIEHRNVVNLCTWMNREYNLQVNKNIIQLTSICFDVSIEEIFGALINGGAVHIPDKDVALDKGKFYEFVNNHQINMAQFVPATLRELVSENNFMESLSIVICGSDRLEEPLKDKILNMGYNLYNCYGPTETTVDAATTKCEKGKESIGKPIANAKAYILDKYNNLKPIGGAGELCVSGAGLARGYLNRPELTMEKFVDNPFDNGEKMYITGDLARWLPDGSIEFLGRIDHQVKIRGYRIELGEIENKLLSLHEIKATLVIAKEDELGNKYLCAYLVAERTMKVEQLREYLGSDLPEYMIPSYFIQLEEMPLTSNGKVDRKKLPEPDLSIIANTDYVAPRNSTEENLCTIWQEVLRTEKIGIKDNFFAMGGDSIKAIQVSSRIQRYGLKLQIKDLLRNPTIEGLSKYIEKDNITAEQGLVTGEVELIPIQHWFFENSFTNSQHYNQAVMLYSKDGFEEEIISKVFTNLVEHHDILRSTYIEDTGKVKQVIRNIDGEFFDLKVYDLVGHHDYREIVKKEAIRIQESIDLSDGPLVKLGLFKTKEGDNLLIVIHHLVVDGVSWRIIFEDLATGYKQIKEGNKIQLPKKTSSYKEWANTLKEYAKSRISKKELDYWSQIDQLEIIPIIKDSVVASRKVKDNKTQRFTLTKGQTQKLLKEVNRAYNTEINDILLTALGMAVSNWTNAEKILINLEGHGREVINNIDISRTIGWFTTMYPVVLDMPNNTEIGYQIKLVKEAIRHIPNKGIGYGIIRYLTEQNNIKREPEISFNYLGQFDGDINTGVFGMSQLSTESVISEESENTFALDINGMVAGEQLSFDITYNNKEYKDETIEKLINGYKEALINLTEHCLNIDKIQITPSDLGMCRLNIDELEHVFNNLSEKNNWENIRTNIKEIYPLTPMQEGMLFHRIMNEESTAYFEQTILEIEGKIDISLYQESLNKIIERYDVLRTIFVHQGINNPVQIVLKERKAQIDYKDITGMKEEEKAIYIENLKTAESIKNFDLAKDILIRITIVQLDNQSYKVIWSFHHIVMDGWCMGIIMGDFMKIYNALRNSKPIELGEPIPYSRFIRWLEDQDKQKAEEYWNKYLQGYEEQAIIPKKRGSNSQVEYAPKQFNITIDEIRTKEIKQIANDNQVTINTILQTVWGIILQRYNRTEDVVFGAVVSGRPPEVEGVEGMVGLFINTIPVRIAIQGEDTFSKAISRIQEEANKSKQYEYSPLADIQANNVLKQNLLDHIMVFENFPMEEEIDKIINGDTLGFTAKTIENLEQTNYDLNIIVMVGKEVSIGISYNSEVYDYNIIHNIGAQIGAIIYQITIKPDIRVNELDILSKEERHKLLVEFNNSYSDYPRDKTIQQLFEAQVESTPDNIAVVYEDNQITYRELNNKSNQLARILRDKGVKEDSIVGLVLERSIDMIIGIMAVLKAGGAYLPIDPDYPKDRIAYILKDSNTKLLLTHRHLLGMQDYQVEILLVDELDINKGDIDNLDSVNHIHNLAYVMYTSGSTGKPKGNLTNHQSIIRVVKNTNYIELDEKDTLLQLSTYAFDGSTFDIFGALLNGAKLVMINKDNILELEKLSKTIIDNGITVFFITTALFNTLVDVKIECLQNLRKILFGGEQVSVQHVKKALEYLGEERIIHVYGPTESTVYATWYPINSIDEGLGTVPIGKPISNTEIYILDENNNLQPIGSTGELCISGDGLVKGYLNRPELTAEKFILNPFKQGERMYKTGDLAKWLSDGNIEFVGRVDHQIKMRGFRIELGEIENQIMKYDGIKESVVIDNQDETGNKYLCSYFSANKSIELSELKEFLSRELPQYMIPTYFIQLDKLPLTSNGKIDRKAFTDTNKYPQPDKTIVARERYEAPRNIIEEKLVKVWEEVLKVDGVGISDNFFELGGHSLKATSVTAKIHKEMNIEIPIKEIFNTPTIKELSDYIKDKEKNIYSEIQTAQQDSSYPDGCYIVSSAQKRLYTLQQFDTKSTAYNMPAVLLINGELDIDRLNEAFKKLIERHESLRTSFDLKDGELFQKVHKKTQFNIEIVYNHSLKAIKDIIKDFVRPFDLSKAPLLRVRLVVQANNDFEKEYVLMYDMHHIISDGVSMDILTEEFIMLYQGKELADMRIQYKDFAAWQNEMKYSEVMMKQEEYWLREFSGDIPVLKLPTDYVRPAVQSFEGDMLSCELDSNITNGLNAIAKETGATLYMVMLASYNVLLSKYTLQEDIVVGTPIAGRPHEDLNNIIGMFVNTLAIRNYPKGKKTFKEFLKEVKWKCLDAYENQDYQFDKLTEKLSIERDMSRNPLFDVMFILQNFGNRSTQLEGIMVSPYSLESTISKFDITVTAVESYEKISLDFEFCTALFKKDTIQKMSHSYIKLLSRIIEEPDIQLDMLKLESELAFAEAEEDDDVDFGF